MKMKYTSIIFSICTTVILLLSSCNGEEQEPNSEEEVNAVFIEREEAEAFPGYELQGEYSGSILQEQNADEFRDIGLQVAVYGENEFMGIAYEGGIPGEFRTPNPEYFLLEGREQDNIVELYGDGPVSFRYIEGEMIALDKDDNSLGRLDKVRRQSSTLGAAPPNDAKILFDGTDLNHWGGSTEMTQGGLLKQGATTADKYGDMKLHIEAKLGFMPLETGQARGNSGIYIQNRYEVQILDSFGLPPEIDGNGSLYNESKPLLNTTLPPLRWQTYDIYFKAPRFDQDGNKIENARITAYLNGHLIQNDVELESGTGFGGTREEVEQAELLLQDHGGDPVRFRNIWIVEEDYSPPEQEKLSFEE